MPDPIISPDGSSFWTGTEWAPTSDSNQIKRRQNRYCHYQKQNPHTPRAMEALGLDPDDVKHFIEDCLFPED